MDSRHAPTRSAEDPAPSGQKILAGLKQWVRTRHLELLLFLLLWGTYAYFYQSTQHNEAARFDQMRAMLHDHTLAINSYWWNSADVIHYSKDGTDHIYPNKAPGGTLLGLVPFAVVTLILQPLHWWGVADWIYWHLISYFTVLSTVSVLSAIAGVAMFRILRTVTGDSYLAVMSVVAIWLGTLAFPYSTLFFSHQLAASLLTLAFALIFSWKHRHPAAATTGELRFFITGGLLGAGVISEYPTFLLAALISVYALWTILRQASAPKKKASFAIAFSAGAMVAVIALVSYNLAAFGKWAYVPIEAYAAPNSAFPTHARGLLGFQWNGFAHFLHALAAVTVYPKIGILYVGIEHWVVYACSPVLWLSLPGMAILIWRRETRSEGLLVLAMTIVYLLFITSYGTWEYDWAGGSYFGSRHLVPLFGFLALPIAVVARRLRFLFYPLLAVSIFYMLLGTAVEPRVGYPMDNPHRDIFLPEFLRGHLAQNTSYLFDDDHHLLTRDSTAFNLGKLARLPARHELAPLMLWWLLTGGALIIAASEASGFPHLPRARLGGLFGFVVLITLLPIIHHAASGARHSRAGLFGKYYRNRDWSGKPIDTQVDPKIDFDWSKSFPLQPPFSVEWSGSIDIQQAGTYTFSLVADDGAALEIDGRKVIDALAVVLEKRSGTIALSAGAHAIRVRYFNALFGGSVKLTYTRPGHEEQVVPPTVLVPRSPNPRAPSR